MMSGCQTRILLKSFGAIAEIGLEDHMCGWGQQIMFSTRDAEQVEKISQLIFFLS